MISSQSQAFTLPGFDNNNGCKVNYTNKLELNNKKEMKGIFCDVCKQVSSMSMKALILFTCLFQLHQRVHQANDTKHSKFFRNV